MNIPVIIDEILVKKLDYVVVSSKFGELRFWDITD